jgi:hypothetical protein
LRVTPFECYTIYLALKQHFSNEKYDFFQYNGKVRASIKTYNKRNDRYFFEKLSRKYNKQELIEYFVASFIIETDPSRLWVGDLKEKAETNYLEWMARVQSLDYRFRDELKKLTNGRHLFECIKSESNKHPEIIKQFLKNELSLEVMFILDDLLHFMKESEYDPILKNINLRIKKYRPFFAYDKEHFKAIIRQLYVDEGINKRNTKQSKETP